MALWENLGRKASGTTAKAVHQAKMFSEVTRINTLIGEERKEIEKIYFELGKLYAAVHRDDYEADFAELMGAVAEAEQRIEDYQTQIQRVRGVQCCANCGAEVPKDSAFCTSCGSAMPRKEAVVDDNVCTGCGAVLAEGVRFCTSCGTPRAVKAAAAEVYMQEPVPVKRTCPSCGSELEDDMAFCTECGTKVV